MSCYEDYRDQVYVFRDEKNVGNLEEALAEAYGYVSFDAGASELGLKRMVNELLWSDTAYEALVKIAKNAFLSCSRPPGYREGILFIQEFENLLQHQNPLKSTAAHTEFKGLSWLYDELVNQNPHNPKDYNTSPNVIPSDTAAFTQFIQSFRYEHSQWEQILPHPIERSSQRKASFTCQFTPPVTIYTIPSRHLILILEEIQQTMQSIVKQQADFSTQILAVIEGQTRKIKDFIRKSKPPRKPPRKKKQKPKSKGTDKKA